MIDGRPMPPPDRLIPELREALPVLTEVLVEDTGSGRSAPPIDPPMLNTPVVDAGVAASPQVLPQLDLRDPLEGAMQAGDEERVAREVLSSLQGQVDRLFEFRVRNALEPMLQNLVSEVVRQARDELAVVMVDVVRRAISQELAKRKLR